MIVDLDQVRQALKDVVLESDPSGCSIMVFSTPEQATAFHDAVMSFMVIMDPKAWEKTIPLWKPHKRAA